MVLISGCASAPPSAAVDTERRPLVDAIRVATDGLLQGLQQTPSRERRVAVLDPTLDAGTGQQTPATLQLDKAVAARLSEAGQFEVLPFEAASLSKATQLLTGTLQRTQSGYGVNLSLVDIKSATVIAQSSALARADGVDMRPLPYYRDSPMVVVKDKVIDGYIRTASLAPGQKADANYVQRIAAATVINNAAMFYNAARYREALGEYRSALSMPTGEQLRALNGLYLSHVRLGQMGEAEEAFGRLVAYGVSSSNLGVKFLFNPGSTDFWSDPKVTSAYSMWLRQIARQANATKVCMDIIGHSSATGTESVNDALSLRRAMAIKRRLGAEVPDMLTRLRTQGMGAKQNIVGTGSDDVVDAPDRRVEFAIIDCPS